MKTYSDNHDKPIEEWLEPKLQSELPEKSAEEVHTIVTDIVETLEERETQRESLRTAIKNGSTKEKWFADEMKKATAMITAEQGAQYINNLNSALNEANAQLARTCLTQNGITSSNPSLNGFIAEQYHAQTFNLNAEAAGSHYRAEVLEQNGTRLGKNSVDLVIKDAKGKIIKRYQSKYESDSALKLLRILEAQD